MKIPFKPGTLIYPLPAVMVTCGDCEENYNIITIGENGITEKDLLVHDKTTEDTGIHMMLAHMMPPHFPVAIGVIRDVKAPTFNDSLVQVIENEKAASKIKNMDDLLSTIWILRS